MYPIIKSRVFMGCGGGGGARALHHGTHRATGVSFQAMAQYSCQSISRSVLYQQPMLTNVTATMGGPSSIIFFKDGCIFFTD